MLDNPLREDPDVRNKFNDWSKYNDWDTQSDAQVEYRMVDLKTLNMAILARTVNNSQYPHFIARQIHGHLVTNEARAQNVLQPAQIVHLCDANILEFWLRDQYPKNKVLEIFCQRYQFSPRRNTPPPKGGYLTYKSHVERLKLLELEKLPDVPDALYHGTYVDKATPEAYEDDDDIDDGIQAFIGPRDPTSADSNADPEGFEDDEDAGETVIYGAKDMKPQPYQPLQDPDNWVPTQPKTLSFMNKSRNLKRKPTIHNDGQPGPNKRTRTG